MKRLRQWCVASAGVTLVTLLLVTSSLAAGPGRHARKRRLVRYITAGTLIPITASTRVNSRRTTATVASRNFFRP
jgi:hypothetical protein